MSRQEWELQKGLNPLIIREELLRVGAESMSCELSLNPLIIREELLQQDAINP